MWRTEAQNSELKNDNLTILERQQNLEEKGGREAKA
jgi:hypothetical protein